MNTADVIAAATRVLQELPGHSFDVLELSKPVSPDAAVDLMKIVSKLSPLLGNLIEINTAEILNDREEFDGLGEWERQDPDFPDVVFRGVEPTPGFEVKAWFPLATEITGRFKDSQNRFAENNTEVAIFAWLPEHLVHGRPYILDVCIVSGLSVAQARDLHYHNPPDYLVVEPEDTSKRTRNLQQTNTAGYKWQGTAAEFEEASELVRSWGSGGAAYQPTSEYQERVRELMGRYKYRLDTNFAKMDRIVHAEIEAFKSKVMAMDVNGLTVSEWGRLISGRNENRLRSALEEHVGVTEEDSDELIR